MIGLDTTACIDFLNGYKPVKDIINHEGDMLCTTVITLYEVQIGLLRTKRKISEERYKTLNSKWLEFLSGMEILTLKESEVSCAAEIFDLLEASSQVIDDNDILIAAILMSNNINKIITRNTKHFNRINRLITLDYK